MDRNKKKTIRRGRRKTGIRKRILGMPERPRLSVFRSAKHIYGQVIDDLSGKTIASASSRDKGESGPGGNVDGAKQVGTKLAERAKAAGISKVVFDRNGFRYHGRVKAFADAAREGGLEF
ncbi:MAG: 50S ribosomal protein L18 [Planctomycetota bacterium]|nr:50S ribosomal protein L18 [Planctomycetota bacterium]